MDFQLLASFQFRALPFVIRVLFVSTKRPPITAATFIRATDARRGGGGGGSWCGDVTRRERVLVRNCQLALTYRSDGTLLGAFKNSWLPSERTALNNQIPPSPHPPSLPLDSENKWNAVTGESTCDWDPEEND